MKAMLAAPFVTVKKLDQNFDDRKLIWSQFFSPFLQEGSRVFDICVCELITCFVASRWRSPPDV